MEKWGVGLYGDPCRECGFGWELSPAQAVASVRAVPDAYARRLAGATGRERHPDLAWTAAAYVSHVTDNLRTWAERLAGGYLAGDLEAPGYGTQPGALSEPRTWPGTTPMTRTTTCGTSTAPCGPGKASMLAPCI